ncbi:MAG: hypothetical protein WDW38_004447 [Sanguina aurantia]
MLDTSESPEAMKKKKGRLKKLDRRKKREDPDLVPGEFRSVNLEAIEEMRLEARAEAKAKIERAKNLGIKLENEDDPRRYNFHRALLTAASKGRVQECEELISQMEESGLQPGPRAFHVLIFAYVRAKDRDGALEAVVRADDLSYELLPETYVVLMFLLAGQDPPEMELGKQILQTGMGQGVDTVPGRSCVETWLPVPPERDQMRPEMPPEMRDAARVFPTHGWQMLIKELFRKRRVEAAMDLIDVALAEDIPFDSEIYRSVLEFLCGVSSTTRADEMFDRMSDEGIMPGPEHYNPYLMMLAANGQLDKAKKQLGIYYVDAQFSNPNTESFNSLLAGLVKSIRPLGAKDVMASTELETELAAVNGEMQGMGLRADKYTYKSGCEAFIQMHDCENALINYYAMKKTGGSTRLLSRKFMSQLIGEKGGAAPDTGAAELVGTDGSEVLLAKMDKPADLLHILQAMLVDNFPIPRRAGKPVPGALNGGSIVSAWLDNHLESMSAFRGQRKMQEVIAQETSREIRVSRGCAQCLPHDPGWEGGLRRRVSRGAVPRMTRVGKAGEPGVRAVSPA